MGLSDQPSIRDRDYCNISGKVVEGIYKSRFRFWGKKNYKLGRYGRSKLLFHKGYLKLSNILDNLGTGSNTQAEQNRYHINLSYQIAEFLAHEGEIFSWK